MRTCRRAAPGWQERRSATWSACPPPANNIFKRKATRCWRHAMRTCRHGALGSGTWLACPPPASTSG
eukprot:scaffold38155_cov21-Phaeocystis_antarctica.AAC.1